MRNIIIWTMLGVVGAGCAGREVSAHESTTVSEEKTMPTWSEHIAMWPETSKKAAGEMVEKYGPPAEMTDTHLVWHEHGPWKRATLSREEVMHDWPTPHVDVLEQVIDFRVDPARYDELAQFDGSVIVERTKGELSARCGGEAANFLAVNLAHDVATGKRTVQEARTFYEQTVAASKAGEKPQYMQQLVFTPPSGMTEDRDEPAMMGESTDENAGGTEQTAKPAGERPAAASKQ